MRGRVGRGPVEGQKDTYDSENLTCQVAKEWGQASSPYFEKLHCQKSLSISAFPILALTTLNMNVIPKVGRAFSFSFQ